MDLMSMSNSQYAEFNAMRSSIKTLVKAQLLGMTNSEQFANDNKHTINQLVENASRDIVESLGKPTRREDIIIPASRSIVEKLKVMKKICPAGYVIGELYNS